MHLLCAKIKWPHIVDYVQVKLDSTLICHTEQTPQECRTSEGRRKSFVVVASQTSITSVVLLDYSEISELLASLALQ